jgi:hypothetical protein
MRIPDFFIVGAPKCGTTAMYQYLAEHPEIYTSPAKELHLFGTDLTIWHPRITKERYLFHFSEAKDEKRLGEASVWYLYSRRAAQEIREFSASAGIIIMLRNPVDMLYSLHSQFLADGDETLSDFKAALEAERDRKRGLRVPVRARTAEVLFYRDVAKYTQQVQRYFDAFGRENVHIIIYDDLQQDLAGVYGKTLQFLNVDTNYFPDFRVINPNRRVRAKALRHFIVNPPRVVRWLAGSVPHRLQRFVVERLTRLSIKYEARPPMDSELRRSLQVECAPEVERLSELLGRDLTLWSRQ